MNEVADKAEEEEQANQSLQITRRIRPVIGILVLLAGLAALILASGASIAIGTADIHVATVWQAIFHFDPHITAHQVIQEVRLPRVIAGIFVGASLAVAGALMQGMTRNPIADSGLLGLNSGAAFVLALCFAFAPNLPYLSIILYSFLGAGLGAGIVFGIGSLSRNGLTPMRLVLAGAAVSALLVALSQGIGLYYDIGQDMAFWYAGGLAGIQWTQVKALAPWILAALAGAMAISRSITVLSLGDEVSAGLGQRNGLVRAGGTLIVLVLAGAAVSAVGVVGFVGLIIPHIVRYLVGVDYRWVIPGSAVFGALLVVVADTAARMVNPPYETPMAALIAVLGVPFFLYLVRRGGRELK
ncbi:ferrichrome ABC transporter permease [Paenibacillus sp. CAA11]|uniref:FecCD family ABC transporter permease n=1 Tax=Paenibacillus sp. CAA11 TaxID=1532905 RepID=UPI000D3BFD55|nr:iron ABC transporter permease [Paenibacillus sp. CAA11]AWB46883.1 ferrichrome ABC transporter permease [Paenibacillus sp. CAA11]